MSNNVKAGGAYVELTVRDKLKQGFDEARAKLSSFAGAFSAATGGFFGGLAAVSISGMVGKITEVLSMAGEINDASARLGLTAREYQSLAQAANMNASSIEELGGAFVKFNRLLGEAEMGSASAAAKLDKYGLSVSRLAGMSPEEKLGAIADAIASIDDPAVKTAAAMELLGRGGAALIPLLQGGSKGLEAFREQAKAAGLVASDEDIARAGALNDSWGMVGRQAARVGMVIYNALVPAFEVYMRLSRGVLASTIHFIDTHRGLVQIIFGVGAAIASATAAYYAYAAGVAAVNIVMPVFTAVTMGAQAAVWLLNSAMFANPVGAVVAAILAAVAGVLVFSGALNGLSAVFSSTWGGIVDAIMGGNLQLAWDMAITGLKLGWAVFTENVTSAWNKVVAYISKAIAPIREQIIQLSEGLSELTGGAIPALKRGTAKGSFENGPAKPAEKESERLQRELDALREQAAAARAKLETPSTGGGTPGGFDIDAMMAKLAMEGAGGGSAGNVFSGRGYFSSAAAGSLTGSQVSIAKEQLTVMKRVADAAEDIAENTAEDDGVVS